MLRRTASCLLFALLAGAAHSLAAGPLKVQVVQTHTGVKLGPVSSGVAPDSDAIWTRCSGDSGTYAKELGYFCAIPASQGDPPAPDHSASSLFFDISVIMPDAARLVFHCSTVLDGGCEGFPEYPQGTSMVCSDFAYSGRVYKDCVASGSSPQGIGIYRAELHGDRMTIFGANWQRRYIRYGTWEYPGSSAQDSKPTMAPDPEAPANQDPPPRTQAQPSTTPNPPPATQNPPAAAAAVAQDSKPENPPATKPALPSEAKPDASPDSKPAQQETRPALPQGTTPEAKPDTKPAVTQSGAPESQPAKQPETKPDPNPAASAPSAAPPDLVLDPQVIEQAKAGDPVAQYKLGYDYFLGRGVPLDYVQAAIWWRKAADQGMPQAQNNLGVLYNAGKGVPQSYAEAYFWQNLAAARASGQQQAQFAKNRDESGSKLWFITRNKIQQRAQQWAADHPVAARTQEPREAKQ